MDSGFATRDFVSGFAQFNLKACIKAQLHIDCAFETE